LRIAKKSFCRGYNAENWIAQKVTVTWWHGW